MDLRNGLDVPFVLPDEYQGRYDRRMEFLKAFDTGRKVDSAWAPKRILEWESFTRSAHKMLKSPAQSLTRAPEPPLLRRPGTLRVPRAGRSPQLSPLCRNADVCVSARKLGRLA